MELGFGSNYVVMSCAANFNTVSEKDKHETPYGKNKHTAVWMKTFFSTWIRVLNILELAILIFFAHSQHIFFSGCSLWVWVWIKLHLRPDSNSSLQTDDQGPELNHFKLHEPNTEQTIHKKYFFI